MSRRLGQHFLIDKTAIVKIVRALSIEDNDTIIEIGPGHGELTTEILKEARVHKNVSVIAVEKDMQLFENLVESVPDITVVAGDALSELPRVVHEYAETEQYKIVGNIPYYITGRLLRVIGDLHPRPERVVLTVQKEVAERIVAQPPNLNLLAASVQIWSTPEIIMTIPKKSFRPPPEVISAVLRLTTNKKQLSHDNLKRYYEMIHIAFKHPRKTLGNNLKTHPKTKEHVLALLDDVGAKRTTRPQELDITNLEKLSEHL